MINVSKGGANSTPEIHVLVIPNIMDLQLRPRDHSQMRMTNYCYGASIPCSRPLRWRTEPLRSCCLHHVLKPLQSLGCKVIDIYMYNVLWGHAFRACIHDNSTCERLHGFWNGSTQHEFNRKAHAKPQSGLDYRGDRSCRLGNTKFGMPRQTQVSTNTFHMMTKIAYADAHKLDLEMSTDTRDRASQSVVTRNARLILLLQFVY